MTMHLFLAHPAGFAKTLERRLWASADPFDSSSYGKHWAWDEVTAAAAPSADTSGAVRRWLGLAGVSLSDVRERTPDIWEVSCSVDIAERLMPGAKYYHLTHERGSSIIRTTNGYSLPTFVSAHIDLVGPTHRLPSPFNLPQPARSFAPDLGYTKPEDMRKMYGAEGVTGTQKNNSFAVCGFLGQHFDPADVAYFFQQYDIQSVGRKAKIVGPNSGTDPADGLEATLDVSYGMAMAGGVSTTFWSTPGKQPLNPLNEPFLQWLADVAADKEAPYVFSISYSDNENTVDEAYAVRVNTELMKAGVRGISILGSSGDGGVSGTQPDKKCKTFVATFPAASPYVTAVGGTAGSNPEKASGDYPSGGGFSKWWSPPSYQTSFIDTYFTTASKIPNKKLFNASGAGYPDVSMQSENFVLTQFKVSVPVSGTSCSTPSFAGFVALLNDARLAEGKSTLGWLNPLLYANPQAFNDITSGNNPGCAVDSSVGYLGDGFYTAVGWDPVTGLGTPKFQSLLDVVKALP